MHNSLLADKGDVACYILRAAAMVLSSMNTKIINKKEIASGTHSEDSMALVFPHYESATRSCITVVFKNFQS